MRSWNRLAFALFVAACSHPRPTAEPVAVPLTAATAQIAAPAIAHADLAPWSLTASDGSGLTLSRVQVKAVVQGPLAYTELHLWFHNPEMRRREGTFAIALPPHSAVSRFAMASDGTWLEAEVVERQLARRAYDDFLHRRQDPALLEKAPGNQFTAKVFPIAPGEDKQIIVAYSQELRDAPYALPLRGLSQIGAIDIALVSTAADGAQSTQELHQQAWQPDRDFVATGNAAPAGVAANTLVAVRVPIAVPAITAVAPTKLTLLVDTSASRALGYAGYVADVHALIGTLAARYGNADLAVVAFDQDHEAIYSGPASGWSDAHDKKLIDRGAAGASDLGQALAALGDQSSRQVIVVGDGVITAGLEHQELAAAVKRTRADRLDVALAGGLRDDVAAGELVHAGLTRAGAVLDLDAGADEVAAAIAQPIGTDVPIAIAGATWQFPKTLATARAGTTAIVYARLAKPQAALDVAIGRATQHVALVPVAEPLVDRALASAEIEQLEAQVAAAPAETQPALRKQLAVLSVKHRVVSDEASLLVLETAEDYRRYGIEPKALADLLVIGPAGVVERVHRTTLPTAVIAGDAEASPRPQPGAVAMKSIAAHTGAADDDDGADDAPAQKQPAAARRAFAEDRDDDEPTVAPAAPTLGGHQPHTDANRDEDDDDDAAPARHHAHRKKLRASTPAVDTRSASHEPLSADMPIVASPPSSGEAWPPADSTAPLAGQLAEIEAALAAHRVDIALAKARDWHASQPGDVLALVGLGDALEANGNIATAARVYGSIIDLFPGRADLRRFAGERMQRLARGGALSDLVVDTYRRAVVDRPDHLTGHRLYAYALERAGKHADAFAAVLVALDQPYRNDSYAGGLRTLRDDAGLIGAAYAAAVPSKRESIVRELQQRGIELATTPSTRFILYWETDANDVDFHIQDAHGNHAYYAQKQLASGGALYADITTGYGPECFAIPGVPSAGPYELSIYYFSQGPMGYGMGLVEAETFDGKGHLKFDDRPYVIMNDRAYVDLGKF